MKTSVLKTVLYSLLIVFLLPACNNKEKESLNSNSNALKFSQSDFTVTPSESKLLIGYSSSSDQYDYKKKTSDSWTVYFDPQGGTAPYQIEIVSGPGKVLLSGYDAPLVFYADRDNTGKTILKITDSSKRVALAMVETATNLKIELLNNDRDDSRVAPCRQVEFNVSGGFPPYQYQIEGKGAKLVEKSTMFKATRDANIEFKLVATDSQGNSLSRKIEVRDDTGYPKINYCFGNNGKIDLGKPDEYISGIIPVTLKSNEAGKLFVAGAIISNNTMITPTTLKGISLDLDYYLTKSPIQLAIAQYDANGMLYKEFGTNGQFVLQDPEQKQVTKAELIQPLSDGGVLVAGLSQIKEGLRLFVLKLNDKGQLVKEFGKNGVAYSDIIMNVGWDQSIIGNFFGYTVYDKFFFTKKMMLLPPKSGGGLLVQFSFARTVERNS